MFIDPSAAVPNKIVPAVKVAANWEPAAAVKLELSNTNRLVVWPCHGETKSAKFGPEVLKGRCSPALQLVPAHGVSGPRMNSGSASEFHRVKI